MGFKVAVVGATGNVGREMLDILAERRFPADEVVALASARSIGTEVSFGDKVLKCKSLENFDFSGTDICLMSAVGGTVSKEWSPKIAAQGCVVIDNSSAWRYDSNVPLIVPEVNADAIIGFSQRNIIANPNCSTAQLVVALKPLHDKAKISLVVVRPINPCRAPGLAMGLLFAQTCAVFVSDPVTTKKFSKRIAFNVIPEIDVFMEDGYTKEEWKMMAETKKISHPKIKLTATCVRVPVFIGHAEAVNIEFEHPISAKEAQDILARLPAVSSSTSASWAARSRRMRRPARDAPPTPPASARMQRSRTVSRCGASPTISARARR